MSIPGSRSIRTIFVVDDEKIIASKVAEILRLDGFDARYFISPLQALDAAKEFAPDLVITDIMMPELTGVDLAIRLKEACPDCRVLLFSGHAHHLVDNSNGAEFPMLHKPIHPQVLLSRVKELAG